MGCHPVSGCYPGKEESVWGRQNAQGEAVHKEIPGVGEAPVLGSWDGEGRCSVDETQTLAKVVCYLLFSAEQLLLQLHLPPGTEALSFLKVTLRRWWSKFFLQRTLPLQTGPMLLQLLS